MKPGIPSDGPSHNGKRSRCDRTSEPSTQAPSEKRDDLHDRRARQRFRQRECLGDVSVSAPSAPLDEVRAQQRDRCSESAERDRTDAQERNREHAT